MTPAPSAGAGGAAEPSAADAGTRACTECPGFAPPEAIGHIEDSALAELSGLAASWANEGMLYAHNDHDRPLVYAIDNQGRTHARIALSAASVRDVEDIAVGPCPTGSCVFLADIGDNAATRGEYAILRFAEPTLSADTEGAMLSTSFERFAFRYPDGSHNAEGLMVGPDGTLYVVTKYAEGGHSSVYSLPASPPTDRVSEATRVVELPIPTESDTAASAAAMHPCGLGFVVRTYNRIYLFRASGADYTTAFQAQPESIGMPDEPQSEGITFAADGSSLYSAGEGRAAPLMQTRCAPQP